MEEDAISDFEEGYAAYSESPRKSPKKPCNQRIEELSTPGKRMFLALWNEHAHHFPQDKIDNLQQLLQQLYAMSPEETIKYFDEQKAEAKASAKKKKAKQEIRKYLAEKHEKKERKRAYRQFKKILKIGILYAIEQPTPIVVPYRLRYLSDVILHQLSDLRGVVMPDREDPDKLGKFLISVADWMAASVEKMLYEANAKIPDKSLISDIVRQGGSLYEGDRRFPKVASVYSGMDVKHLKSEEARFKKNRSEIPDGTLPKGTFIFNEMELRPTSSRIHNKTVQ